MLYSEILDLTSQATLAKEFLEGTEKGIKQILQAKSRTTIYYPGGYVEPDEVDVYHLKTSDNTSICTQLENNLAMVQRALVIAKQVDKDISSVWLDLS